MATETTWYTQMNVPTALNGSEYEQSASVYFNFKAMLLGQIQGTNGVTGAPPSGSLWTVHGSSDGVTAGMDGVDRWGSTFDLSKIIWSGDGEATGAKSWFVLKSPDAMGPVYITMVLSGLSALSRSINIRMTYAAPTGGSSTTQPVAADYGSANNQGGGSRNFWMGYYDPGNVLRCNMTRESNGSFHFTWIRPGLSNPSFFVLVSCVKPAESRVGDEHPVVFILNSNHSQPGVPYGNHSGNNQSQFGGHFKRHQGLNNTYWWYAIYITYTGLLENHAVNPAGASDADPLTSTFPFFPTYLVNDLNGATELVGRNKDFYFCRTVPMSQVTRVFPATGPVEYVQFFNYVLPFGVAPMV